MLGIGVSGMRIHTFREKVRHAFDAPPVDDGLEGLCEVCCVRALRSSVPINFPPSARVDRLSIVGRSARCEIDLHRPPKKHRSASPQQPVTRRTCPHLNPARHDAEGRSLPSRLSKEPNLGPCDQRGSRALPWWLSLAGAMGVAPYGGFQTHAREVRQTFTSALSRFPGMHRSPTHLYFPVWIFPMMAPLPGIYPRELPLLVIAMR